MRYLWNLQDQEDWGMPVHIITDNPEHKVQNLWTNNNEWEWIIVIYPRLDNATAMPTWAISLEPLFCYILLLFFNC